MKTGRIVLAAFVAVGILVLVVREMRTRTSRPPVAEEKAESRPIAGNNTNKTSSSGLVTVTGISASIKP